MDTTTSSNVGFAEDKAYARIVHCLQSGERVVTDLDDTAFGPLNILGQPTVCEIHTLYHPSFLVHAQRSEDKDLIS